METLLLQRVWSPPGDLQTAATLDVMRREARRASVAPRVCTLAALLSRQAFPRNDRVGVWRAVRQWLKANIRFLEDPEAVPGHEVIRAPEMLIAATQAPGGGFGDCDDVATLAAALGLALGFDVRLVVVAVAPSPTFVHVYAEYLTPAGWADLDTTKPDGLGVPIYRAATLEV